MTDTWEAIVPALVISNILDYRAEVHITHIGRYRIKVGWSGSKALSFSVAPNPTQDVEAFLLLNNTPVKFIALCVVGWLCENTEDLIPALPFSVCNSSLWRAVS